jgi:hypothetical protein
MLMAFFPTRDSRATGSSIKLKLREIAQLFNSLDPSPFSEQDLDHDAEEFIVSWARELPRHHDLRLVLNLERPLPAPQTGETVGDAIRHYFSYRASINRLELREFFKRGRTSLLIGTTFLAGCLLLVQMLVRQRASGDFWSIVQEGLTIVGWVAMWRPMEIYLYDWWPLKRRDRLLLRLSRMKVEVIAPRT